jgi:hypothetical protein
MTFLVRLQCLILIFEAFFDYILIGNKQSDLVWFGRSQLQEMQSGIFPKFLIIGKRQKSDRDQQVTVCFVNHSDGCTVGVWRKENS